MSGHDAPGASRLRRALLMAGAAGAAGLGCSAHGAPAPTPAPTPTPSGAPAPAPLPATTPWPAPGSVPAEVEPLLRRGGCVIAFRHARAPGTFDPPGMRLDDCRTQRNLDDAGRAQARRIGQWFSERRLQPLRVRSSPWCRCQDTATLAFGTAEVWPALGSPVGQGETVQSQSMKALRQALTAAAQRRTGFEAWVTHMFVLSALTGESSDSGEGLVLVPAPDGTARVLARLNA